MYDKQTHRTEPDHTLTGYPPGVPYIIGNEGCERFSFYGMRAILYIYIVGLYMQLRGMSPQDAPLAATATNHLFIAGVYFVPLIGGILADRLLGKYRTILYLSIVYCLGHLALAVFETSTWQENLFGRVYVDPIQGLGIGLFLICVGSGGIKPCVSAHVGDQFGRSNWHLLQKIFNAFYFIINFGSFFATLAIPVIRGRIIEGPGGEILGYEGSVGWAFGIPGILMGLATIFFWMGRKVFIHVPPSPGGKLGLLDTIAGSCLCAVIGYPMFFASVFETNAWQTALVCAGFLAAFVVVFAYRQRLQQDDGFLAIMFHLLMQREKGGAQAEPTPDEASVHPFWRPAVRKFGLEATEGPIAVLKIVSVFFLVSVFWALFDQHSSTWIEQAKMMDRVLDLGLGQWLALGGALGLIVGSAIALPVGKTPKARLAYVIGAVVLGVVGGAVANAFEGGSGQYELLESQIPATNPIMVMILISYTTFGLYPLADRLGFEMTPLRRMTLGMFVASLAFVSVAVIQLAIDVQEPGEKVHVAWQLIPYALITLSEVMVSITGLEFAYSQAPKRMKSVVMSFWLLMVSVGNVWVVLLAGLEGMHLQAFFWTFAGLMGVAALLFGLRARTYRYRDFTQ